MKMRKVSILLAVLVVVCGIGAILFPPVLVAGEKTSNDKLIAEYTKAIAGYTKAIELTKDDANAHIYMQRGCLYWDRGKACGSNEDYDLAILDFTKAIELAPDSGESYKLRGKVHVAKGAYDEAITDFTRATEVTPSDPNAYFLRAVIYCWTGDYDRAWEDVYKAESLGKPVGPVLLKDLCEASQTRYPAKGGPPLKYATGRDTLVGLQGVHVVVEEMRPEAEKYGLSEQSLQTDVELRLRQYGVRVFSQEESMRTPGRPWLYVNVNPLMSETIAAVSISITIKEDTFLQRNKATVVKAATWSTGSVALLGLGRLNTLREDVRDKVDQFINDYYAANPTKKIPDSLPVPKAPEAEPPAQNERQGSYFTQGSHKDDVLRAQGTPDSINRYAALGYEVWGYGFSTVQISMPDGRVTEWDNLDGNLKVRLGPTRTVTGPTAPTSSTVSKPSQKGRISAIVGTQGSRSAMIGTALVREGDTVDGVTVVKIHEDRVVFERVDKGATIRWTQKVGDPPDSPW